jgi:hypothetical protein
MQKVRTVIFAIWKAFVGAVFCQFPVTSLLAIGWSYRAMQRRALRVWEKHSPLGESERAAMCADRLFAAHEAWPNWFLKPAALRARDTKPLGFGARIVATFRTASASLGDNLRVGVLGFLNTSVIMILPALLWQFGWLFGWDNSFNKGYEQFFVGRVISLIGIFIFLGAMLYLPMAQARQAVTGDWRAFYHFRTIWAITRNAPIRSKLLAAAYALASFPIAFALVLPLFFEQTFPFTASLSDSEYVHFLERYYFRLAIYGFIAYVFVRWLAAGWYARTLVELLHTGRLKKESLAGDERRALALLRLDHEGEAARLHPAIVVTLALSRPVWRTAVLGGAVMVWFIFVAQIYVREFLDYHPIRGFMNQPLIQLPWFRYIPGELVEAAKAEARQAGKASKTP